MNLSLRFLGRQLQYRKWPLDAGPAHPDVVLCLQREEKMEDWGIMNECVVARETEKVHEISA